MENLVRFLRMAIEGRSESGEELNHIPLLHQVSDCKTRCRLVKMAACQSFRLERTLEFSLSQIIHLQHFLRHCNCLFNLISSVRQQPMSFPHFLFKRNQSKSFYLRPTKVENSYFNWLMKMVAVVSFSTMNDFRQKLR